MLLSHIKRMPLTPPDVTSHCIWNWQILQHFETYEDSRNEIAIPCKARVCKRDHPGFVGLNISYHAPEPLSLKSKPLPAITLWSGLIIFHKKGWIWPHFWGFWRLLYSVKSAILHLFPSSLAWKIAQDLSLLETEDHQRCSKRLWCRLHSVGAPKKLEMSRFSKTHQVKGLISGDCGDWFDNAATLSFQGLQA